jgi:phosphomevalonate kinase
VSALAVARAPGKLLLTGAYAVLEGAPALVVAVDRYAVARGEPVDHAPAREIAAAFPSGGAPTVDTSSLYYGETKLGLGSSAAALVAAVAAADLRAGAEVLDKKAIFLRAREAHQRAQGGGSGVDVAASTFGGVLRYQDGTPTAAALPTGVVLEVWWSGTPARTSSLLGQVRALAVRDASAYRACMGALVLASENAADSGDSGSFLGASRAFAGALRALGSAAAAPIVPPGFSALGDVAAEEGGAFFGSGAGGGDVAVFLGNSPSSPRFRARAAEHAIVPLALAIDFSGVSAVKA